MKKIYVLVALGATLCSMAFRHVAEPFEGIIRYETAVTGEVPKLVTDRLAKHYELRFKESDLKIIGDSPLKGEIVVKKNSRKMYIVRRDQKNVYEVDLNDKRIPENTSKPKVSRLQETLTVAGYSCQKYEVQYDNGMKLYVWAAPAINMNHWGVAPIFGGHLKLPESIVGFPLKLQLISSSFTITGIATDVKPAIMEEKEFALPDGMTTQKL